MRVGRTPGYTGAHYASLHPRTSAHYVATFADRSCLWPPDYRTPGNELFDPIAFFLFFSFFLHTWSVTWFWFALHWSDFADIWEVVKQKCRCDGGRITWLLLKVLLGTTSHFLSVLQSIFQAFVCALWPSPSAILVYCRNSHQPWSTQTGSLFFYDHIFNIRILKVDVQQQWWPEMLY